MNAHIFNKLIKKIAKFDEKAFEEIYQEYSRLILWIALKVTKNREDAEDVLSIVITDIWNNAAKYPYIESPDDWISVVAKNKAIKYYNKNVKRQSNNLDFDSVSKIESFEYFTEFGSCSEIEFDLLISSLKESEQKIVKLKVLHKFTHEEISKQLNLPLGTVMWRFNTALKKLRIKLSKKNLS